MSITLSPSYACNVVIAAGGYPGSYRKGDVVTLSKLPVGCSLFHAGTRIVDGQLVTNGGRVFNVLGVGHSLPEASAKAYEGVRSVSFPAIFYRKDIGHEYGWEYEAVTTLTNRSSM